MAQAPHPHAGIAGMTPVADLDARRRACPTATLWPLAPRTNLSPPENRQMAALTLADGTFQIDADLIAKGLGMTPQSLRAAMQAGAVTSTCEKGEGTDAGRTRVTFYAPARRLRLTFDAAGQLLQSSSADYVRRPPRGVADRAD